LTAAAAPFISLNTPKVEYVEYWTPRERLNPPPPKKKSYAFCESCVLPLTWAFRAVSHIIEPYNKLLRMADVCGNPIKLPMHSVYVPVSFATFAILNHRLEGTNVSLKHISPLRCITARRTYQIRTWTALYMLGSRILFVHFTPRCVPSSMVNWRSHITDATLDRAYVVILLLQFSDENIRNRQSH
jgi:hypothetical protein